MENLMLNKQNFVLHILYWIGVIAADYYMANSNDVTMLRLALVFYVFIGSMIWFFYFLKMKMFLFSFLIVATLVLYGVGLDIKIDNWESILLCTYLILFSLLAFRNFQQADGIG